MADERVERGGGKELSEVTAEITVAVILMLIILALFGVYLQAILDKYNSLLEWIYSKDWRKINFRLAIIFSLINIGMVVFLVKTLRQFFDIKKKSVMTESGAKLETISPKDEVKENWEHIQELIHSSNSSDWNMAIIRADALLEDVLMHLGYQGETMADRLKLIDTHKLPSLDRVWSAHRLRNAIAHDPMEQHTRENLQYAIKTFEQALTELGLMEKKEIKA
ncbi:MAG: hypothetical protein Q8R29_00155 [bacterium]|nr:hypothetical protein [bacterium]